MPSALLYCYDGCEPVEIVSPADVLRRCGVNTILFSQNEFISTAFDIKIKPDTNILPPVLCDVLLVPGGSPALMQDEFCRKLIEQYQKAGKILALVCGAGAAVSSMGLLNGVKVTTYPGYEPYGSKETVFVNERVVVDGKTISAQGPGVSLELGVEVAKALGCAGDVARAMLIK